MIKNVKVGDTVVRMKATASTPRLYRIKFGRDIFKDMENLKSAADFNDSEQSEMSIDDLTMFENVSFIMARQGDVDDNGNRLGNIPDTVEDWLDSIEGVFSVYEALPQIVDLWGENIRVTSESKKKKKIL